MASESKYSNITRNDFPEYFIFGSATSAYQHEGGATKGGRGLSVWDAFTMDTPGKIVDGSNGNEAAGMYTRYKEDIKMMKSMGFDAYRFSISWPRILPGGKLSLGVNQEGIDYYNDLINTLIDNKIKPFATLFHWDLPYTLAQEYGGFLSRNIVDDFRDFAELCFWEFGDRVKDWITLNEPWSYSVHGYVGSIFPPGKLGPEPGVVAPDDSDSDSDTERELLACALNSKEIPEETKRLLGYAFIPYRGYRKVKTLYDLLKYGCLAAKALEENANNKERLFASGYETNLDKDAYTVGRNLLLAHAEAVHSYRTKFKVHQKGQIGITLVTHWFEPLTDKAEDIKAADRALDFMLGWFLEPVLIGSYPKSMQEKVASKNLASFTEQEVEKLRGSLDFLGLNYYTSFYVAEDKSELIRGYNGDQKLRAHKKKNKIRIGEKSGAKWLHVTPWGFYKLLASIDEKYNTDEYVKYLDSIDNYFPEIYITENGYAERLDHKKTAKEACRDPQRIKYYQEHLGHLLKVINSNDIYLDIAGYFAWSWCDNFEWADGYTYRFGLVYIDYMNNLKRCPKDSAMWFAKFLLKNEEEEEEDDDDDDDEEEEEERDEKPKALLEPRKPVDAYN